MNFTDKVNYLWGYFLIEIGKGKGKEALTCILLAEMKSSYDRGYKQKEKENN